MSKVTKDNYEHVFQEVVQGYVSVDALANWATEDLILLGNCVEQELETRAHISADEEAEFFWTGGETEYDGEY